MKYIIRLAGLPFFICLAIIGLIVLFVKYVGNYMMYGGEAIAYTKKTQRKTIQEVFEKLTEEK